MLTTLREHLWLAEHETRSYFSALLEYVELWERWLAKTMPNEVLERLQHGEGSLKKFYEHISLFLDELDAAFSLIASTPNVGHPYRRSPVAGTRRILLAHSRYHVYYAPLDDELIVLPVWHASRGSGPPFRLK